MSYHNLLKDLKEIQKNPTGISEKIVHNSPLMKQLTEASEKFEELHTEVGNYLKNNALPENELFIYMAITPKLKTLAHNLRMLSFSLTALINKNSDDFENRCVQAISESGDLELPDLSPIKKLLPDSINSSAMTEKINFSDFTLNLNQTIKIKDGQIDDANLIEPEIYHLQAELLETFNAYQNKQDRELFENQSGNNIETFFSTIKTHNLQIGITPEEMKKQTAVCLSHDLNDFDTVLSSLREMNSEADINFLKQLNALLMQVMGFTKRQEAGAAIAAIKLCKKLMDGYVNFSQDKKNNKEAFKNTCKEAFKEARPILEKHRRVLNKVLINVALAIVGFGIGFFIAGLTNLAITKGKHFFFFNAASEKRIDAAAKSVNKLTK